MMVHPCPPFAPARRRGAASAPGAAALAAAALLASPALLAADQPPASAPPAPAAPEAVADALIPNYTRLTARLAAAGQPTPEALHRLKELGFGAVVNLRTDGEPQAPADEADVVRAQGLRYVAVPVTADTFSQADVDAVQRVLDDPSSGTVLLHCGSSNRVGAVWAVIRARADGLGPDQAVDEGRQAGLRSPGMIDAVKRVLSSPQGPP